MGQPYLFGIEVLRLALQDVENVQSHSFTFFLPLCFEKLDSIVGKLFSLGLIEVRR